MRRAYRVCEICQRGTDVIVSVIVRPSGAVVGDACGKCRRGEGNAAKFVRVLSVDSKAGRKAMQVKPGRKALGGVVRKAK